MPWSFNWIEFWAVTGTSFGVSLSPSKTYRKCSPKHLKCWFISTLWKSLSQSLISGTLNNIFLKKIPVFSDIHHHTILTSFPVHVKENHFQRNIRHASMIIRVMEAIRFIPNGHKANFYFHLNIAPFAICLGILLSQRISVYLFCFLKNWPFSGNSLMKAWSVECTVEVVLWTDTSISTVEHCRYLRVSFISLFPPCVLAWSMSFVGLFECGAIFFQIF